MNTDKEILENAADLLEKHGHPGAQVLREFIRKRPELMTVDTVSFLNEGGELLFRGSSSQLPFPTVDIRAQANMPRGRLESPHSISVEVLFRSAVNPDWMAIDAIRRGIRAIRQDPRWIAEHP